MAEIVSETASASPPRRTVRELLFRVSGLVSQQRDMAKLLRSITEEARLGLGAAFVEVRIEDPRGGCVFAFQSLSADSSKGDSVTQIPLAVRRRNYGTLNVALQPGESMTAEAATAIEILALNLALSAETASLRAQKARLREEARRLYWRVRTDKRFSRATGIVEAQRRISRVEAANWLHRQASARGCSTWEIADLVIRAQELERRLAG